VAVDEESVAETGSGAMDEPETSVWLAGAVTETVLVMSHVKSAVPTYPSLSVTVMTTG